jgi:hypothetical protein
MSSKGKYIARDRGIPLALHPICPYDQGNCSERSCTLEVLHPLFAGSERR